MTKIDIISGFLGAGKTTWIKKLISQVYQGEQIVLIENEFGEIGIDGGFLKDAGIEIKEMNSGCICCSLVGDFGTALQEVIKNYHPDRIIIEPSGVGKLSDVISAVKKIADSEELVLNCLATVADAGKCKMYMKNFGEFYNNQIQNAKTIILSRTANIKEEKLKACVALLREQNPEAAIITTPWEQLGKEQVVAAMEESDHFLEEMLAEEAHHHHDHGETCTCGCHGHEHHHHHGEECHDHEHHHADDVFSNWGIETPATYSKEKLEEILQILSESEEYGIILRAKGILPSNNGKDWFYFDLVPEEFEIRNGNPDYTGRICVIGSNLKKDKIEELFFNE